MAPALSASGASAGADRSTRRTTGPGPLEMVLVAGLAFFLNLSAGTLLQLAQPRLGLLFSEFAFIAAPAVLAVRLFYLDPDVVLPLGAIRATDIVAAVGGALALNHLLTLLGAWQETVWPTPAPVRVLFDGLFVSRGGLDLAILLGVFALTPAVCEEILFRGFLQSGLTRVLERPAGVVFASALVFAIFHLDPWRFSGILGLGLFLAWLRLVTGSLVPPMAAHAASNVLSIVLKTTGHLDESAPGTIGSAAGAIVLLAGAILTLEASRRSRDRML